MYVIADLMGIEPAGQTGGERSGAAPTYGPQQSTPRGRRANETSLSVRIAEQLAPGAHFTGALLTRRGPQ